MNIVADWAPSQPGHPLPWGGVSSVVRLSTHLNAECTLQFGNRILIEVELEEVVLGDGFSANVSEISLLSRKGIQKGASTRIRADYHLLPYRFACHVLRFTLTALWASRNMLSLPRLLRCLPSSLLMPFPIFFFFYPHLSAFACRLATLPLASSQ